MVICTGAMVGAQRMGLDLPVKSEAEIVAVALLGMSFIVALIGLWRILGPHSLRRTAGPTLMRAPRFDSERTTGPSNIGIRG